MKKGAVNYKSGRTIMTGKNYTAAKFRSLLPATVFSFMLLYISALSGKVIAAWILSTQALAAISIVGSVFTFIYFASKLITGGTTVLSGIAVGRQNRDEANRYFSQGVILSFIIGILLSIFLLLFKDTFFSWFNVSQDVLQYAREYYNILIFLPVIDIFVSFLYKTMLNEGAGKLCAVSVIVQFVSQILLSLLLCNAIGIAGIALGYLISCVLTILIVCLHFFQKHCQIRFKWYISGKHVARVFKYSLGDSMGYLYATLFVLIINVLISNRYGEEAIIIFGIVIIFQSLLSNLMSGIGKSIMPLTCVYHGEDNLHGINKTMGCAIKFTLAAAVVVTAFILVFASFIPGFFNLTNPQLAEQTAFALRIYAPATMFFCVTMLFIYFYSYVERLLLSNILTLFMQFLVPLLLCYAVLNWFGIEMIWAALAISAPISLALCLPLIKRQSFGRTFPLLLDRESLSRQFTCDAESTAQGVIKMRDKAEAEMRRRGIDEKRILKIMLMIEEVAMLAVNKKRGKIFYIECTLFFNDEITLILRDSGSFTDSTEDTAPNSIDEYLTCSIVAAQDYKLFSQSAGSNRTVFQF